MVTATKCADCGILLPLCPSVDTDSGQKFCGDSCRRAYLKRLFLKKKQELAIAKSDEAEHGQMKPPFNF